VTILIRPELAPEPATAPDPSDGEAAAVAATLAADGAGVRSYRPVDVRWRHPVKRSLDVVLAGALLVATSPLLLAAIVAVKATSRGPALFRQVRVGRGGRLFTMLKVRTMVADAEQRREALLHLNEADGPLFKIAADPRVTRVGRVLRKLSIDELPQLINVIRGDMSLVGPRPALPSEVDAWHPELHGRLQVRPGITGLWQVSGRSDCTFDDYARYDLEYVATWTISTDLAILARTVPHVLSARGAR
jgi:lipopolysaccharide/colanic/teichoic acid biosynthesis glycosyltransferase